MTSAAVLTFVFDSTNGALWAEEVAVGQDIPVDVVPSPPESGALCDLALLVRTIDGVAFEEALKAEGVPFRLWSP